MAYYAKHTRLLEGIGEWTAYFRANPHRFAEEYLGIKLHLFQKILIFMCFRVTFFMYIASRSQGKSWLIALICIIRCILYPESSIILASGTRGQAKLIITQKIIPFRRKYANIDREIQEIKTQINDCYVLFKNGSKIEAVTSNESGRGYRGNVLVLEEFRQIKEAILKSVLKPFLGTPRQPPYLMKEEYKHLQEENIEIYISSAWYRSHWAWDKFKSFAKGMVNRNCEDYFVCGLNYKLSLHHGILTKRRVESEMSAEDFDPVTWSMEYGALFFGENEKSFFKLDDLDKNRILSKPFYPIPHLEFIQMKNKGKIINKFIPKKQDGEIRIIGNDVALMGGAVNDQSIFAVLRLIRSGDRYERQLVYMESLSGIHSTKQAIRLKQLFFDFDCDYVAMDTQGKSLPLNMVTCFEH